MLMNDVFILVCTLYPVTAFIDWELWESTMSDNTKEGESLSGGLSALMKGSVVCGVVIQNWTKWRLHDPAVYAKHGRIKIKPSVVLPGQKESLVTVQSLNSGTSVLGSASWLLGDKQKRVVVTWSVPAKTSMYKNWLAIGITKKGVITHKDSWTKAMYKKSTEKVTELGFRRERFHSSSETIIFKDSDIEVTGKMGTKHKSEVLIVVRPLIVENLADSLRKLFF